MPGPQRGDIESTLRLLQTYGQATVVGDVKTEDPDASEPDAAAVIHEPGAGDDARNGAA